MSAVQHAEADALRYGHLTVFNTFMRRINGAQFDIALRGQHARSLEVILRRDLQFFRFVEDLCTRISESLSVRDVDGADGVAVLQLMLASASDWPLGPGVYAEDTRQVARAEYLRIFGSL